jgi:two-component system, response regulator PdtaR
VSVILSLLTGPNRPTSADELHRNPPLYDLVHSIGNARRTARVSVLSATRGDVGVCALQATRKPVTVLVVEDDWIVREDVVTDLRQEGWAVLEAATGAGALQALHEVEKVDLLITDIGLADGLTGWDVAEAFRTSHPEVPVIYTSGNPVNDHRRVAGSVFLSKPVAVSDLTATCRKLLARPMSALIRGTPVINPDSS